VRTFYKANGLIATIIAVIFLGLAVLVVYLAIFEPGRLRSNVPEGGHQGRKG